MSMTEDEYRMDEFLDEFVQRELRQLSEAPAYQYLATYGDAIEARVRVCVTQARQLVEAGHPGAALVRAAAGIEVIIRFFLARPLLQGAFLSDEWAQLLAKRLLNGRTAEDRELLPAILRNWKVDLTNVKLSNGQQVWEQVVGRVWQRRNDYVHKAADVSAEDARCAIECAEALLSKVVDPLAERLGFTRQGTGCWSVIQRKNPPEFPDLNPPVRYEGKDPFVE
jgi:hypothetical protein